MVTFKPASLSLFLSALLASSSLTNAQSLPDDIVGCKDVSCPKEKANYRCTVDQNTFLGVGLSRIPNVPRILDGISLIKGVNISNPEPSTNDNGPDPDWAKETRPFKSVYYLGTPSGLNVDDLTGCAVIFNDAPARSFSRPKEMTNLDNTTNLQSVSGTCPEVIEQSCIDTLTERTRRLAVTSASGSEDACALLERELNGESFDECADLGGMNKGLGNFTVVSLSDLSTISGERNSSSDCWPVLPKSDNLAEIGEHTIWVSLFHFHSLFPILDLHENRATTQ